MRSLSSLSQVSVSGVLCSNYHLSLLELRRSYTTKAHVPLPTTLRCHLREHDLSNPITPSPRRSADFDPSSWNYGLLGSLPTQDFTVEKHGEQREKMIAEVKDLMRHSSITSLKRLKLVDAIERLGLERHFQQEIKYSVEMVYHHCGDDTNKYPEDLYATALRFRMLRQHGYFISQGIFKKFKEESGKFSKVWSEDVKGLLSLYEATFIACKGDESLDEARAFATKHLKEQVQNLGGDRAKEVQQALDLPLHWRFPTLKARWSIEAYHDQTLHPTLIRLAKLDYNLLQSAYKEEIKRLVRWWTGLELPRKLPYMRDRLLEHYLWILGFVEDPQYHNYREMNTKVACLVTAVDDTYDVYGTVEELEIFTDLVDRWDISGIDQLPEAMRWCFVAIYNTSNEIASWTLEEKRFNVLPYLSNAWARLCKSYLQEAKWYREGYKPTLMNEYLPLASVSISGHLLLLVTYFLTTPTICKDALHYIDDFTDLVRCSCTVFRLINDLATSSAELARGDNMKALQCYMNETGASERVARTYIEGLINETWKKMNEEYYLYPPQYPETISQPFLSACINYARASHFFYSSNKDWHGKPDKEMINHVTDLLINPVPLINL